MTVVISFLAILALCMIGVTLLYWPVFRRHAHPPILSVSAGIGITYVFLVLLPKLAEVQASLEVSEDSTALLPVELHAYLGALAGFVIFLLIANKGMFDDASMARQKATLGEVLIFCVFSVYYAQIGFLLGEWPSENWLSYLVLVCAVGMHLLGINYHLWKRYPRRYPSLLRWLFSGCLVLGWVASVLAEELSGVVKLSTMFVAGGIIITAIREEIPAQKDANIPYFLAAVLSTTAFILFTEIFILS